MRAEELKRQSPEETALQSKVRQMLRPFNRQKSFCFKWIYFESKKAGWREKDLLRLKLSKESAKWENKSFIHSRGILKLSKESAKRGNSPKNRLDVGSAKKRQWSRKALRQVQLLEDMVQSVQHWARSQKKLRQLQTAESGSESSFRAYPSLSFSYTLNCGAFLFLLEPDISIGFDIERPDRMREAIVRRVSSKKEWAEAASNALHPALLWGAKEAALKCLSNGREKLLMKHCLISKWRKTKNLYLFTAQSVQTGEEAFGSACLSQGLSLSYVERELTFD